MSPASFFLFLKKECLLRTSGTIFSAAAARFFMLTNCVWLSLILACPASIAQAAQQERVLRLDSDIHIHADTTLSVKERITIFSTGDHVKRGIIREFPAWFTDDINHKVRLHYLDLDVSRDGQKENFNLQLEGDTYRLYIGAPHKELTPGEHRYDISYMVLRRLQYFNSYDLLVWNVTGPKWGMPVERITATVSLPKLTRPILRYKAYINGQGSKGVDFDVHFPQRGRAVFTLLRPLKSDEDFSIAVAWPKGLVNEPTALEYYDNN